MLSRANLAQVAATLTDGNLGHAQTLYLQDIVLATISRETADDLVFKGGTALLKFYQLDRFSDDLDFTSRTPIEYRDLVAKAVRDLENYGATVTERSDSETDSSFSSRLGIEGPLFTGDRRSLCFLAVHINTRSTATRVAVRRYTPMFPDIRTFELGVLAADEILAEKIRALVTRHQPRDLYDTYHLLTGSNEIDRDLVEEKLAYYDRAFDRNEVLDAARELERAWGTLDALVYATPPAFDDVIAILDHALPE